jgi:TonB-linked SusC/RagA family outer membrane protein
MHTAQGQEVPDMSPPTVSRRGSGLLSALAMALFLALPHGVDAQDTGVIRGTITDQGGQAVSSVQVYLEDTQYGALSAGNGVYQIQNVPAGQYTVVAQRIGYAEHRTEGVTVTAGQTTEVNVQLTREALELAGVVVTGVTEATARANLPFTVSQVGSEQIPIPPRSAMSALQGRVAGASVISNSQPGQGDNILLRTPTSLSRSNQPLIVVDGVIITGRTMDISNLDIESIEVVKGAAAASMYGSRAAAGVIQIRTARGSSLEEGRTQFRLRSEYGSNDILNPMSFATRHNFRMDAQGNFLGDDGQPVSNRFLAATTDFGFQDQEYPGPLYDHIGALFNPGGSQSHHLSVGHNTGETSWLATAGHQRDQGIMREHDGYHRTDLRLNVDHRPRDDLSISMSASHMASVRDDLSGEDGGDFFAFVFQAPDVNLLEPDPDGTPYHFQPDEFGIRTNPLYHNYHQVNEWEATRTLAAVDLRYYPISWLSFDGNVSYDRSDRLLWNYVPKGVKTPARPDGDDGSSRRDARVTRGINASGGLSVNQDIGPFRVRSAVRALIEDEYNHRVDARGSNMAVGGIPDLGTNTSTFILSSESQIRSEGYFLTSEVGYQDRYQLNALVRHDGSSLFGPDERWHTYYRLSGQWRMAQEDWWRFDDLNEFRLRYSRGTAGGRPNFSDRFEVFSVSSGGALSLGTLGNRRLRPEKTTEQEFGFDLEYRGRLSLGFTHARQVTEDQLLNIPLPMMFGFSSQWQNAGTIEGKAYEVEARFRAMESPTFSWTVGLVADRSRSEITEFDRPCYTTGFQYRCAGEQIGTMVIADFARQWDHINNIHSDAVRDHFQVNDDGLLVAVGPGNSWRDGVSQNLWGTTVQVEGQSYDWGMPIIRVDENGLRTTHEVGNGNPDLTLGFSNHFRWGNLQVYGLIESQIGGQVYNATHQRMHQWARSAAQDQHNKPDERKKPLNYYVAHLYDVNRDNGWWVEDADFVRLREVSLSYAMDAARFGFLQNARMDQVTLSLVGRNLALWTDYQGYDPAVGSPMNRRDSFAFPSFRTITASVDIRF